MLKIGLIVADDKEFAPLEKCVKEYKEYEFMKNKYIKFSLKESGKEAEITAVLCGIGKVNAASAAAFLIGNEKVDMIINFGLSGILSELKRGDIQIGTSYQEHDFDITPFGLKRGIKPQPCSVYEGDKNLIKLFTEIYPEIKPGAIVSGDQFICSGEAKKLLANDFGAQSCDMESAAAASVCYQAGVPFAAIRRMSDDANEKAAEVYTDMNNKKEEMLALIVLNGIKSLLKQ